MPRMPVSVVDVAVTRKIKPDSVVVIVAAIVITMPVTGISVITGNGIPVVMVMPRTMAILIAPVIAVIVPAIMPVITAALITITGIIPPSIIPGMLLADTGDTGAGFQLVLLGGKSRRHA